MKATGIVRRIDDLGRIVVPKEIRRALRIREGDPLEIFTDGDSVIFKKYNIAELTVKDIGVFIEQTYDCNESDKEVYAQVRSKMIEAREILLDHERQERLAKEKEREGF